MNKIFVVIENPQYNTIYVLLWIQILQFDYCAGVAGTSTAGAVAGAII